MIKVRYFQSPIKEVSIFQNEALNFLMKMLRIFVFLQRIIKSNQETSTTILVYGIVFFFHLFMLFFLKVSLISNVMCWFWRARGRKKGGVALLQEGCRDL